MTLLPPMTILPSQCFCTEQGHCGACRRKWRLTDTYLCPCGKTQTMFHIVKSCPLTKLNDGLSWLHSADEDAVSWLTSCGPWHAYDKKKCLCWSHVATWHVANLVFFFLPVSNVALVWLLCHHSSFARAATISTNIPGGPELTAPASRRYFAPVYFHYGPYPSTICLGTFSATCGVQPRDVESLSRSKARFQHRREELLSQWRRTAKSWLVVPTFCHAKCCSVYKMASWRHKNMQAIDHTAGPSQFKNFLS